MVNSRTMANRASSGRSGVDGLRLNRDAASNKHTISDSVKMCGRMLRRECSRIRQETPGFCSSTIQVEGVHVEHANPANTGIEMLLSLAKRRRRRRLGLDILLWQAGDPKTGECA